jgi:hypothetical protein
VRLPIAVTVARFLLLLNLLPNSGEAHAQTGQGSERLRVQVDLPRGPQLAGQGFVLAVGVVAADERPRIEPPRIAGARAWLIGTDLRPIATSGIGTIIAQQNVFWSRFRVVADRPGNLEIPPIAAQIHGRTGSSPARRLEIYPVPLDGRPAEFLGGVGQFTLKAEADPSVVRLGQELKYRITVTGPAAWGSRGRPDLARAQISSKGLRVVAEPDEAIDEPPSRTFVYRMRPTRAAEIILPPVSIAAFDPAIKRYVTKASSSVMVRVVEPPSFNPASIEGLQSPAGADRFGWLNWTTWTLSAVLLSGASVALVRVRWHRRNQPRHGPAAAQRFAAGLARTLGRDSRHAEQGALSSRDHDPGAGSSDRRCWAAAHEIIAHLTRYLELGWERPPGALTPIEARQGVVDVTGSDDLGIQAEQLAAHCDLALYGEHNGHVSAAGLLESARQLFRALGLVKSSRRHGFAREHPQN